MGRPSLYKPEFVEQAEKLCKLGATNVEIADFFEVGTTTIERWASEHAEFRGALKAGKDACDDRVERSLFHRAIGYSFDSVKIFQHQGAIVEAPYREHVPPDTTAMIFWLKNRRRTEWRDRHEVEHDVTLTSNMAEDQLSAEIAKQIAVLRQSGVDVTSLLAGHVETVDVSGDGEG